jgi:hypothetical protein
MVINLYKARGFRDKPIESTTIHIHREIMDDVSIDEARAVYQKEALTLAEILFAALPGGVIDALLIEFLTRKRSLLAIPHAAQSQESGS